jgi:NADH-quinone oxidoreductase subunit H
LFIPWSYCFSYIDLPFSIVIVLAVSSLGVHGIIFSGWASNSKYSFLGSIRSASQILSYEICISTIYLTAVLLSGSFSLSNIVFSQQDVWFIFPLLPIWILFVITSLAETNRAPFDLPEAEAELVAGYNVEYSAIAFALFFLAEYGNMILMSIISTLLFFGGWNTFVMFKVHEVVCFTIKILLNMFIFLWVRASFPRYRYDQLLQIGWTILVPISFMLIVLYSSLLISFF